MGQPGWAKRLGEGGKYNLEALAIMIELKADGIALVIVNGKKGDGATVRFVKEVSADVRKKIGQSLIDMGKDMRRDAFGGI